MSVLKQTFPSLITESIRSVREETPASHPVRLLSTEVFPAALESIPADDWGRTWAAGRTIMLRRTSKRVKQQVDKRHLSVVVHLSSNFEGDDRTEQPSYTSGVMKQLTLMTAWCRISTLELSWCAMND